MINTKTFSPTTMYRKELEESNMDIDRYVRGGLWWYMDTIPDKTQGERGITRGDRPILIISNVSNTTETCTMTYLPISKMSTSVAQGPDKLKEFYAVSISMPGGHDSYVVCNQPTTGVTNHLRGYIGQIKPEKMKEVENELLRYMGMVCTSDTPSLEVESTSSAEEEPSTYPEPKEENRSISQSKNSDKSIQINSNPNVSKAARYPKSTRVRCIETGKVYECMTDAAKELNVHVSYIGKAIRGKIKNPIRHFELI